MTSSGGHSVKNHLGNQKEKVGHRPTFSFCLWRVDFELPNDLREPPAAAEVMGEQAKTIEYRFDAARPHEARSMARRVYRGETDDYAPAEGNEKSHPRNQKEKSRKRLFVLFTILFSLFTFF